jgi:protein-S-isoprenylcysteine O-methyltransferase Ste14
MQVGLLLAALLVPPLLARIRSEEALLRAQFGADYDAYCARTSRRNRNTRYRPTIFARR